MTALGDIRSERKHRDCSGLSVRLVCGGSSSEGTEQGELGFVTKSEGLCDEWIYMVYLAVAYRSLSWPPSLEFICCYMRCPTRGNPRTWQV